jgi:monoamine oxidase
MNNFYKVFGKQIPDPVFYFNTKWLGDPFSRGSYSYIPTGASCTDYEKIAAPINNRIFFAGEATSARYPATMHGAYLSGIREAEKIINFYK